MSAMWRCIAGRKRIYTPWLKRMEGTKFSQGRFRGRMWSQRDLIEHLKAEMERGEVLPKNTLRRAASSCNNRILLYDILIEWMVRSTAGSSKYSLRSWYKSAHWGEDMIEAIEIGIEKQHTKNSIFIASPI